MKRYRYIGHPQIQVQQGMVLVAALVILLALTLIGVSAMGTSTLEERMSSNDRDRQIAFQAAELALRNGEREVEAGITATSFDNTCTKGLCDCYTAATRKCRDNGSTLEYWEDGINWTDANRHRETASLTIEASSPPKYIIEFMGYVMPDAAPVGYSPGPNQGDPEMYRITALAVGQTPAARVMLQSTYRRQP